jgi:hypothetical protein
MYSLGIAFDAAAEHDEDLAHEQGLPEISNASGKINAIMDLRQTEVVVAERDRMRHAANYPAARHLFDAQYHRRMRVGVTVWSVQMSDASASLQGDFQGNP